MSILSTMAASSAFASDTKSARLPRRRASRATGNTPFTARTEPSRASSPTKLKFSNGELSSPSVTAIIPSAIGKSKLGPSFFDVGWRQVDRCATARPVVAAVRDGSCDPVATFLYCGVWQTHDNDVWIAAGAVYFDLNFVRVHSINGS